MFLSLKSICWDEGRKGFFSPSRPDFCWPKDQVVMSECTKCHRSRDVGALDLDCTCGLYSSPNYQTLEEYHKFPNSVLVLMNTYGMSDVWGSPYDILNGQAWVMRSWAMKIVRVVEDPSWWHNLNRSQTGALAIQFYGKKALSLNIVKTMISVNWTTLGYEDPYKCEETK